MTANAIQVFGFPVRCGAAATIAYEAASVLGIPQSVWAAMSAVIVCQETLRETRSSFIARAIGTVAGSAIAVLVGATGGALGLPLAAHVAVAVGLAAVIAHWRPSLRVGMWTSVIVLLTAGPNASLAIVALTRTCEVILGALIGWATHAAIAAAGLPGSHRLVIPNATSAKSVNSFHDFPALR